MTCTGLIFCTEHVIVIAKENWKITQLLTYVEVDGVLFNSKRHIDRCGTYCSITLRVY